MLMIKDPTRMMNELMTCYRGDPDKQIKLFSMTIDQLYDEYMREIVYKNGEFVYE